MANRAIIGLLKHFLRVHRSHQQLAIGLVYIGLYRLGEMTIFNSGSEKSGLPNKKKQSI